MYLGQKRFILFIFYCFSFFVFKAQTLYWVGGSGNFNEPNHWSLSSGGAIANITPSANNDVVFDDHSTNNYANPVITIVGTNSCRSLKFTNEFVKYTVVGTKYTEVNIFGDLELNQNTDFKANSKLKFSSSAARYNTIRFNNDAYDGDVIFQNGNWNLKYVNIGNSNSLIINSGNYKIASAKIKAGNFYANSNSVNFDFNKGNLDVSNVIEIGSNAQFVSDKFSIKAKQGDPLKYKVDPQVNFGNDHKILNSTAVACGATLTGVGISCSGACDGKLILNIDASCVAGPYNLQWNNPSCPVPTLVTVPGPGSYTITNLCACVDFFDVIVFSGVTPIAFSNAAQVIGVSAINFVPFTFVQPTCNGLCNGSITGNVSGSVGPYTVTIFSPSNPSVAIPVPAGINTFTNLCAGQNTFVIVDTKGCTRTFSPTLTQPAALNTNSVISNVKCNAVCNGSVSFSPIGGTAGYTVTFNPGGTFTVPASGSATLTNLCPGVITLTVTDANSCTITTNANITQPPALTVTPTQTNITCGGLCNGSASVAVTGGVAPYTYTWSPGPNTNTNSINSLCAGTQTVSILDNNLCPISQNFTLTSPPPITITPTFTNVSCNALCNGTINAVATGPSGPFTYTLTSSTVTLTTLPPWNNVCANSYTIRANQTATGCFTTTVINLTQPPPLTITAVSQSITCFGLCNGAATVTPSGGNGAPFSFTWTPGGQNAASINTLCVGSYTVAVKDASNCPTSTVVTITQPSSVTANITSASVTCNAACNGSINATPSGPLGPYSFTLASAASTITTAPPYTNLCAGIYTLIIGHGAGCTQTFTINILQPNPLIPSVSSTSITCFNQCNGTLAGSAAGGTPGYTFVWSTPTGTVLGGALSSQCAGAYTFSVTDANGCKASTTATLAQPPDVTIAIVPTNPTCFGGCNGVLSSTVTGGTPGYTLTWSNGPTGNPNIGLCAGNYTLNVVDSKGCIKTATSAIVSPTSLTLTQVTASTSCAGGSNGSATITATGGTAPYSFQVAATTNTTGIFTGLSAGSYICNVTDANGCSQSINFTIVSPIALSAGITGLVSSCNACTGASTVQASNGTPGYTFVWTNSLSVSVGTNAAVSSLCPGNYTVTATDSKGCTATATINVVQTVSVTVATSGSTIQCFGVTNATATANPLGGTLPYSYTWSPTAPTQTTQVATGLGAGTYTVLVADANGCSNTATISFTNPPDIVFSPTVVNVACFGNCNGSINPGASGGTGALSYTWTPGSISTPSISGLCVGSYTLLIKDANGCTKPPQVFNITSSPSITATFTITNPTGCNINNGSVCATASGGNGGPYTFAWSPAGGVGSNTSCYSALGPGTYSLIITAGACSTTLSAIITNPAGPTLNVNTQSITCFGGNTGAATVTAVGGGPFTFTWSPVVGFTTIGNTTTASGLLTGTYNISVTNIPTGCITTQSIVIAQPTNSLTITSTVTPAKCFAACNGSINITPAGGTPGYLYSWSGPSAFTATTQNISGLCFGIYTLNVTDSKACPRQFTFSITQPTALSLTTTASNVLCNAACNGSINVTASGGTSPVTFTWLPVGTFIGSTNQNIFNLCPAAYTVNATDLNGCAISTVVTITQPTALSSTITVVNASCSNSCNATASLAASGGVTTYSFSWSNGPATTASLNSLCAGNYTGTVVDANGCISTQAFTITAPSIFNVTLTPTNPLCNAACNGSISTAIVGAQGIVNFNWVVAGTGQNPTNLCAGNYTLTATDAVGCIATGVASLVNPPALLANVTTTNPACNGNCNGAAISTPANAVGAVSYTWAAPTVINTTGQLSGLCAGNYTVSIKDVNNCTDVQTFTLTNPPVLNVNPSIGPATCGSPNGSITVIPTGGTPAYTFTWSAPVVSTSSVVTGLAAGIYTVIVSDLNGCTNTLTIPLSNSNGPSAAPITSSSISCNGLCTGAASVNPASIVGGTPSYNITWVAPPSTSTLNPQTNLCAGTYTAQITDANSCLLFNSVTILQPTAISILPSLTLPTCNGICNGSITLTTSGGVGPYTYTWSPGSSTTETLTNACAGTYTVLIGNNGCPPSAQTVTLPGVQNMTATASVTNNICFGNCNGTASVIAITGSSNPPINYVWSTSQSGSSIGNLCNGVYTYTATDNIGCFNSFTTNVTSPSQITSTNSVSSPSCNMCNGSGTVIALGGTAPYTYSWTSGASAPTASNLCAGLYQVLVTDGNLCTQLQNVMISNSNGITGEITTIQNEVCAGQCNGAATITAVGGTAPIQYIWISPAVTNSVITNLCAGPYFVQMTDAQGCIRTASLNVNAATQLTLTPNIIAPTCTSADGTIVVTPTGGNPNPFYIYSWAPGPGITSSLTNIPAGNYTVTVTDGSGCQETQAFAISNQNGPVITFTQTNINCFGGNTGSITALGTSTSNPVTYLWSNGSTSPTVSGLTPGVISLTVSSPNGCMSVKSFTLTDNPSLQLSIANVVQPKCHDDCNGAITLVPSGGSLPYTFNWSPLATGNPQFSLCPGPSTSPIIYFATVIDSKGCSITTSLTLNNPASIVLTPTVTNSSCSSVADGALNAGVAGGTPAYSYTWTGPAAFTATTQNISALLPGTYSLTLIDLNGCQKDTTLDIVPTISVVAQAGNDVTVCPTPSVVLTGTNSFGAVSYDWFLLPDNTTTVANTPSFPAPTPTTAPGSFTFVLITTSSVAACADRDTVVVNIYALPFIDAGPTYTIPVFSSVTIGGNPTATGSFSLSWSPSFNLDDPNGLNPVASNTINTVYTVTVIDLTTGCTASDTMTVFLYPLIKIPNGFSPNGDTKNEKWVIDYIDQFPDNTVEVYNRWGEQLFFKKGYNGEFDGKFKGKDLPVGTYYYVINLNHPAYTTPYTGPLTIFR
jgi:gliding motility-associated-like protein